MLVPFLDLRRESGRLRSELEQAASRVIASGWFVLGPELEQLEREYALFAGIPEAVGVASGTDALTLSLAASADPHCAGRCEVVTSAVSAAFTAFAIIRAGCIPRFVDVEEDTLQLDPTQLPAVVSERTRAIVPVHLYGSSPDMPAILEFASARGLQVIEDACQAHGTSWSGKSPGSASMAAAYSFYPTKNLGAAGDAGIVVTRDGELAGRIKRLRHGGQSGTYNHVDDGWNSRLDEMQAALLRVKIPGLERHNEARRAMASRYEEAFQDIPLRTLAIPSQCRTNRHLYPVRTPLREEFRRHLAARGIETLVHYPRPLPGQPALRSCVLPGQSFPVAEKAAAEVLSLPLNPDLTPEEQDHVILAVRQFFGA